MGLWVRLPSPSNLVTAKRPAGPLGCWILSAASVKAATGHGQSLPPVPYQ